MLSNEWLRSAVDWAAGQHDGLPPDRDAEMLLAIGTERERALATLVYAQRHTGLDRIPTDVPWRFANACTFFAKEATRARGNEASVAWLATAHRVFAHLTATDPKYARSLDWCAHQLDRLGIAHPDDVDPVLQPTTERPQVYDAPAARGGEPVTSSDAEAVSHESSPRPELSSPDSSEPATGTTADAGQGDAQISTRSHHGAPAWTSDTPNEEGDDGLDAYDEDRALGAAARGWSGSPGLASWIDRASEQVMVATAETVPWLATQLRNLLEEDVDSLKRRLQRAGIPANDVECHDRAQVARRIAMAPWTSQGYTRTRRRWLVSILWNVVLLEMPAGWQGNRPQIEIDIIHYVVTVQKAHRYDDKARDLLLATQEYVVRRAYQLPEVMRSFVEHSVLASTGTYLLIGGPDAVRPTDSSYDPRIRVVETNRAATGIAPASRRDERERWPRLLLDQWQRDASIAPSAAFCVAALCGWHAPVATYLLERVYLSTSATADDQTGYAFWHQLVTRTIEGSPPIRIAANPWTPTAGVSESQHLVTSDASGGLRIPHSVLRAMAAELTDPEVATTVQGNLFRGRRVPTYLLANQYGPHAVLKLDFADRASREKASFERFARTRLRVKHRPSECRLGSFRIFVGGAIEPVQAIITTYVFDEDERPSTLTAWLRTAAPDTIEQAISDIFLVALRPWLAHVTRQSIDLRMEYPILRPRPGDVSDYAPSLTARSELNRLLAPEISEGLGGRLALDLRDAQPLLDSIVTAQMLSDPKQALPGLLVNPLWVAAELAELGGGSYDDRLYAVKNPLSAYSTLVAICHGDLHGDNVLCRDADTTRPTPILIDFETTHLGHICRDFARLEVSVLAQTFNWSREDQAPLLRWFAGLLAQPSLVGLVGDSGSADVRRAMHAIRAIRQVVAGCGQQLWPLSKEEYLLALLAALLPVLRYVNLNAQQRGFAFVLATAVASALHVHLTAPT